PAPDARAAVLPGRGQPGLRGRLLVGSPGRGHLPARHGPGRPAPGRARQRGGHVPRARGGAAVDGAHDVIAAAALAAAVLGGPDTLVVGTLADPVSLDPHQATDLAAAAIVSNVCETLVRWRPDGSRPEPALATTWATTDGRRWTFTLREGVRFHDGAPLDADAVVANLQAIARARGLAARSERIGNGVVGITLDRPNAALLATLSQPFFSLVSPLELARPAPRQPVGTGPFRRVSARPGHIELQANPAYWGGPPRLARVVFHKAPDAASLAARLLAGEIDLSASLGEGELRRLRHEPSVALDTRA